MGHPICPKTDNLPNIKYLLQRRLSRRNFGIRQMGTNYDGLGEIINICLGTKARF